MKVCLINPPVREESLPTFVPSGLGYLAAYLKMAGHEVVMFDINAYRWDMPEVRKRIKALTDVDVFGMTGLITNYLYMKDLAAFIKKTFPDRLLVAGGASATTLPHVYMEKTKFDCVVISEGELTFPKVVDAFAKGEDLKEIGGLYLRDENGESFSTGKGEVLADIDELPFMEWDLFDMDLYLRNNLITGYAFERSINICGSRGCPYLCNFCYDGAAIRKLRYRSAQKCFEEIKRVYEKYDIQYFRWDDELFVANVKRAEDFCHLLIRSGLHKKLQWGATGRVNIVNPKLLRLMRRAGCIDINYGIESGSQEMLKNMRKVTTVEQGLKAIENTRKAGITPFCSFMVGTRGESPESIRETVEFCRKADLLIPSLFFTTPNPGTELWDYCVQNGHIKDEEKFTIQMCRMGDFSKKPLVNLSTMSTEEFIRLKRKAEVDILRNHLLNNKWRIPKLAYQRLRRVGPRRFVRMTKELVLRLANMNPN
ncbi:MAG: radical SAM protein [Nanoarchaeota archaeon]